MTKQEFIDKYQIQESIAADFLDILDYVYLFCTPEGVTKVLDYIYTFYTPEKFTELIKDYCSHADEIFNS